jgi:alcohol dehydrogenase (cytochrome c)
MISRLLLAVVLTAGLLQAQVSFDRILHADKEPQNWLTYSGSLTGQRFSPLTQINTGNVKNLELQWIWQAKSLEKYEATALVVDGVLYTVTGASPATPTTNDVVALDAASGRIYWTYTYTNANFNACCGRVIRGLAILGDTLYMGTLDAHLIAIDAKTGKLMWNTTVADAAARYSITHAPLVVKDKVIVGTAGGDGPIRGLLAAFDARTGKEVWRFNTIPGAGEPGNETWSGESWKTGGAGIWNTGAYDPETNLTFWGTGNPSGGSDWTGVTRLGDNLYSDSVLALDADTGKLKWHYQFTPHDEMDYDSTQVPVLADMEFQGKMRKVMLWANRNGLMYVLDRTTGEFLLGKPFTNVNWMDGFDPKGRPHRVADKLPGPNAPVIMPTVLGGTNWYPPSYSPKTGLFYIPLWGNTGTIATGNFPQATGDTPMAQPTLATNKKTEAEGYGAVGAFDMKTGTKKWEYKMTDITWAGVLSTAGDVVFSGGREGYFFALDARSGDLLWKLNLGGQVNSGPMSYSVNGRQFVTVAAGNSLYGFALRQ